MRLIVAAEKFLVDTVGNLLTNVLSFVVGSCHRVRGGVLRRKLDAHNRGEAEMAHQRPNSVYLVSAELQRRNFGHRASFSARGPTKNVETGPRE